MIWCKYTDRSGRTTVRRIVFHDAVRALEHGQCKRCLQSADETIDVRVDEPEEVESEVAEMKTFGGSRHLF